MKNKYQQIFYLFMFTCLFPLVSAAQVLEKSLAKKLEGKRNLDEIMKIVKRHLKEEAKERLEKGIRDEEEEEGEKEIYFWNRWANRMSHCVDANGNIYPNIKEIVFSELEKYKASHPELNQSGKVVSGNTGNWIGFGPFNVNNTAKGTTPGIGRVNSIAFHPTDPNTFLLATPNAGIWKTTDGGNYWFSITDDMPTTGIGSVCFDRTNPNTIFALTGDGESYTPGAFTGYWTENSIGILKSTDGGQNWSRVFKFNDNLPSAVAGYKIVQHPVRNNMFFAITNTGIFRSVDFGNTWTNEQSGWFTDFEIKPDGRGAVMYATCKFSSSLYYFRSTDFGDTWTNIAVPGVTNPLRCAIAVSANNPAVLYLLAAGADRRSTYQGVFKSTDSGATFTSVTTTSPNILTGDLTGSTLANQGDYDLCIESKPTSEQTLITGGINIWRRTADNVNFSRASHWNNEVSNIVFVHADIHNLSYNPLDGVLYACHDGGVSKSTNDGVGWTTISSNLQITSGVYGDWLEANPSIICVGTQDNGTVYRFTSSDTYNNISGGDGSDALIHQSNSNDIVTAVTGGINRTTDGGTTATGITPANFRNFYPTLARSFNNDDDIYAGDSFNVFRSTNRGASWVGATTPVPAISILTTCRSTSLQLYAGTRNQLFRSSDAGANWIRIDNKPGFTLNPVTDVEASHYLSSFIYASIGGYQAGQKVYFSTNAGDTWTNISGSLPNVACHSITLDAANNVYVGTDIGVFVRPAGQNDWRPYYNGLPKTIVNDLIVNNTYGRLYAITYGHGNFYTDLYSSDCPPSLTLSGAVSGNRFYEAFTVDADAVISGGMGTAVAASGTSEVVLRSGFSIAEGNSFRAYNAPCGTAGVPLKLANKTDAIPVENVVFKAGTDKPFPNGHLNDLPGGRFVIYYETPGDFVIRITDTAGVPLMPVAERKVSKLGSEVFDVAALNLSPALYYIQLFKDDELVHFVEYHRKNSAFKLQTLKVIPVL